MLQEDALQQDAEIDESERLKFNWEVVNSTANKFDL